VGRVGPSMSAQGMANTLWSISALAATRSLPLPACYPSLWRQAHGLEVGSVKDVHLRMMYHAYLILTELVGGEVLDEVTFPPWITHEAQEAWMRNVRDDVTESSWVTEATSIIRDLGVRCEVERLTDDKCFSVDVFLPDHNLAIEFDGPTHFINASDGGEGGAPGDASGTTRTTKTELRDMFLRLRYRTVVCVPWFEWHEMRGSAEKKDKRAYVVAKLSDAGVTVPAST